MYSGRKTVTIMTKQMVTITEGNTTITYTVADIPEERHAMIEDAAIEFVRLLVESSQFGSGEYTENNGKPVDY